MAKTNISQWDVVAGNNLDLNSISVAEGWLPSTVNNFEREEISQLAKFYDDFGGVNTVTGTNAIAVTTSTVFTALATGMRMRIVAANSNTGATTLNLDAIGAKAVRKIVAGADVALVAGDILAGVGYDIVYSAAANSAAGGWLILPSRGAAIESTVTSASAVSLTTATVANITSLSIPAGDFEVSGNVVFVTTGTTSVTKVFASISQSTGALDASTGGALSTISMAATVPGASSNAWSIPVGPIRVSGSATTLFLVGEGNFTVAALTAYGHLKAQPIQ